LVVKIPGKDAFRSFTLKLAAQGMAPGW
jgi:hypothetical protein